LGNCQHCWLRDIRATWRKVRRDARVVLGHGDLRRRIHRCEGCRCRARQLAADFAAEESRTP